MITAQYSLHHITVTHHSPPRTERYNRNSASSAASFDQQYMPSHRRISCPCPSPNRIKSCSLRSWMTLFLYGCLAHSRFVHDGSMQICLCSALPHVNQFSCKSSKEISSSPSCFVVFTKNVIPGECGNLTYHDTASVYTNIYIYIFIIYASL